MTAPETPKAKTNWWATTRRVATGALLGAASAMIWWPLGLADVAGDWSDIVLAVGALVGGLFGLANWHRVFAGIAALGTVACLGIAYSPLTAAWAPSFVRRDPPPTAHVDAVVVLGAGVNRDGYLSLSALERLLSGLAIVPAGDTTPLVTSVVRRVPGTPITTEADVRRIVTLAGGRNLILVTGVNSTRDEALAVADLAKHREWDLVTVVTSPSHSRRACAAFERAGVTVHCAPSAERGFVLEHLERPSERVLGFAALVYETLGTVVYRLRGWT